MGTIILAVLCSCLFLILLIGFAENCGGYFGDTSLVPGCLVLTGLIIAALVAIGVCIGHIGIWIK